LTANIEKYKKEVDSNKAEESIDFGNGSLFLEVIESGIFRELEPLQKH
jgi:hypothetical protein